MTLIDSRRAILATCSALAAETGVPVDLGEVDRRLGAKLEDEIAHWFRLASGTPPRPATGGTI